MNNNLLNGVDNINDPNFLIWVREKVQEDPMYSQYDINTLFSMYNNRDSVNENSDGSNNRGVSKKRVLSNGPTIVPVDSQNQFVRNNNGAFANWYGILVTLIFSFAIGYLIAWILIKVR